MTSSPSVPVHENLPAVLTEGYTTFWNTRSRETRECFRHLADVGQKPSVFLIGCCDSRVAPEVVFGVGPGEIFVTRNVGALVPPYAAEGHSSETSAAIEYAVLALAVAHIVVMGHAQCGGIRAFALGEKKEFVPLSEANFVAKWKTLVQPAADRIGPPTGEFGSYCERLSHASIIQGLANLRTYPWLREREVAGHLTLHGAYFEIADGRIMVLDQATGTFVPLIPAERQEPT